MKHGLSETVEYKTWINMIQRCSNPNFEGYYKYGGRGIKVCDRWLCSFENFYKDMGKRPSDCTSIDRKDTNGNYEPSNCRWTTYFVQARNQRVRHDNKTGIKGVRWCKDLNKYRAEIYADGKRVHLGLFSDIELAMKARVEGEERYWVKTS